MNEFNEHDDSGSNADEIIDRVLNDLESNQFIPWPRDTYVAIIFPQFIDQAQQRGILPLDLIYAGKNKSALDKIDEIMNSFDVEYKTRLISGYMLAEAGFFQTPSLEDFQEVAKKRFVNFKKQ